MSVKVTTDPNNVHCDFCNRRVKGLEDLRAYPTEAFRIVLGEKTMQYARGAWGACFTCQPVVEMDAQERIERIAALRVNPIHPVQVIAVIYAGFFASVRDARVAKPMEAAMRCMELAGVTAAEIDEREGYVFIEMEPKP